MEIEKLLTEADFEELRRKIQNGELFNFVKEDTKNKIKFQISMRDCDNGLWEDNLICAVNTSHYLSGTGRPYQRSEFLSMKYEDLINILYKDLELEKPQTKQLDMFSSMVPFSQSRQVKSISQEENKEKFTIKNILNNPDTLTKFYSFRVNNPQLDFTQSMQIFMSNPKVTICKSFDEWNDIKRRISAGSKGILYYDDNNPSKKHYVFDISQTYGTEYPPKLYPKKEHLGSYVNKLCALRIRESFDEYETLYNAVKEYCLEQGIERENEEENNFLYRYIATYINASFSGSINMPKNFNSEELEVDTMITLCANAENTALEIVKDINEENYFEIKEDNVEESNEIKYETITDEETLKELDRVFGKTESEPNIEEIREAGVGNIERETDSEISNFDDKQSTNGLSNEYSNASREADNEIKIENGETNNSKGNDLYGENTFLQSNGYDDRRDSDKSNIRNYRLSENDFLNRGGQKTRYKDNIEAIKLVFRLEEEQRTATEEEQKVLARYVGWGGIPQAFDPLNKDWEKEYLELKELLNEEQYKLAKSSVLTAHFTSKTIIDGMYNALNKLGFTNGNILEPALGTGNFIGLLPESFDGSKVSGVEIDDITGLIAKHLYPESKIQINGFENTNFKDNQFDAVITNVPFGAYKVFDRDYDKYNFFIHDYFIAKSIDKIRPNGLCAVITTKGTMDKLNSSFRKHIADRAELVGAIRLPNNAFKENAGTEVTSDILIFKKRGTIIDSNDSWIETSENEDGIIMNNYYIEHPEMLLGTMKKGVSMYGSEDETYLEPDERTLSEALNDAVKFLPSNIYENQQIKNESLSDNDEQYLEADYSVRNFCYAIINNKIYMRVDDRMELQPIAQKNFERFAQMIAIRNQVRLLLDKQINDCSDEELLDEQAKLNHLYDKFVKKFDCLNSRFNRNLFRLDEDYALLVSLENYDEKTKTVSKTDIFSKRTIRKHERVTTANNAQEALQISKNELGKVDIRYMEQLTGLSYDDIINQLQTVIYKNPLSDIVENNTEEDVKYLGWETADEYLSGNVKKKLRVAEQAAKEDSKYQINVEALRQAQPEELQASDITARIGATWIDKKYYQQFLCELLKVNYYYVDNVNLDYNRFTGEWQLSAPSWIKSGVESTSLYGTNRMNAFTLFEHVINLQTPSIYDTITDFEGKEKRVLNQAETIAIREKANRMQQEFKNWIFEDIDRRNDLVNTYNELFNNTRLQSYDGSYLTFPEMNPEIELKPHQKDAVERIITGGNTLLHHVVGAGKTYEIAAAAMKLRQYGLAHKPMIVVPNHLVMQWTREFKKLYPNANVLMATKKDLEKTNRLKFVSRVATGDWDAVVIAASSFEKIPLSKERQEKKIRDEIQAIESALEDARDDNNRLTIKVLEKVKKNKEVVLQKLTDSVRKDSLIKFEDLGVDYLFVDEAHKYKNKFIFTKMNNVAGISKAMSQRATDMEMKCDYINELHNGCKGVVFATGTPISNSMVEMFTMQSYLQKDKLEEANMKYFDAWAAAFGETQTALELAPSGQGYRTKTRFAKFTNLPELMKMYRSFADVKTADMLNLPVPKANKITITAKPSDTVLELSQEIADRAEKINAGGVNPSVDNMLKVTSDGKKLALDPRCYLEGAKDDAQNKINICVENVYKIWKDNMDKKSTQVIFCDLSVPSKPYSEYNPEEDFDVYNDIKYKLVQMGVPENEVRFIHEANTDLQKQSIFDDVRNGHIRVLIGSTEKCGAGTNIQDKLIALHHLDTPYRPSDLEQREGRIIRQGNSNKEVFVYTYVTERTFDSYSYQILENKQKFISQINKGDLTLREASDIDEATLSYAEIKAITTANPQIKKKMELEQEISRLKTLESQYRTNKYYLQDQIAKNLPSRINQTTINIGNIQEDIVLRNNNQSEGFKMLLGSKLYTEKKDAGDMLVAVVSSNKYNGKVVGKYMGFSIIPQPMDFFDENRKIVLEGQGRYTVEISSSGIGSITRIDNYITSLDTKLENNKSMLEDLNKQLVSAKEEVEKPFEHQTELEEMQHELALVDAELDLNKKETEVVIDDEQFKDEIVVNATEQEDEKDDNDSEEETEEYSYQYEAESNSSYDEEME